MNTEFNLLKGEKVIQEIKPNRGLFWYFLVSGSLIFILIFFFMSVPVFMYSIVLFGLMGPFLFLFGSILLSTLFALIPAKLKYGKRMYWITNQRIIVKRGFVGYRINSIPLERISDVLISKSFLENLFDSNSIHIQTLAGQYTPTAGHGSEGDLLAVPNPESIQQLILELIREKRKTEKISF